MSVAEEEVGGGLSGPGEIAKMPGGEEHDSKERVGPASIAPGRSGGTER